MRGTSHRGLSAMALDLPSTKAAAPLHVQDSRTRQRLCALEVDIVGEDSGTRQHLCALEVDIADDDNEQLVAVSSTRISPGELLLLEPMQNDLPEHEFELNFTDEDMATLICENSAGDGLHQFLTEDLMFMDNVKWHAEEEV